MNYYTNHTLSVNIHVKADTDNTKTKLPRIYQDWNILCLYQILPDIIIVEYRWTQIIPILGYSDTAWRKVLSRHFWHFQTCNKSKPHCSSINPQTTWAIRGLIELQQVLKFIALDGLNVPIQQLRILLTGNHRQNIEGSYWFMKAISIINIKFRKVIWIDHQPAQSSAVPLAWKLDNWTGKVRILYLFFVEKLN